MSTINANFDLQYIPARICDGAELCIKYYAYHPVECKLKRVVMRFNHLKSKMNKTELIRHLRRIAHDINVNLANGKNPFIEAKTPKAYCKLNDAIDVFLKIKATDLRSDGMRSYNSFCKRLKDWMIERKLQDCFVISFTEDMAQELMNDLAMNDAISNITWNNHKVFYSGMWNWFIKNNYCMDNVFSKFTKKRVAEKFRQVVPRETHKRVAEYCKENMPVMEIVIDLVRASFIRPKEICLIQIKELDLFNRVISIPPDKAKTHSRRYAYLPEWLCAKIVENIDLSKYPPNYYLIGKNLEPCDKHTHTREIDRYWHKIREDLELPMEIQLYSYRDTGITDLEESGVPRNVIQKLTDHKSEMMVGKYIGKPNKELIDTVVCKIKE